MTGDEVRDQAQSGGGVGLSDENLALHRSAIQSRITFQGLATRPFEGLSWDYFLADVELEARAARIGMRDTTIGSYCDTIQLLPAAAIVRLDAALSVYFLPPEPESEAHVDYLLRPLDAATAKRMRQRRHAVHAMQAVAQQQEEARKKAAAPDEELKSQYWPCPHAALSTEPDDFLLWIKDQTPDTWHVIVDSWDHNSDDRDSVIEWIFEQPNCDLGTAAQYFFIAALGLANEEPAQLSSGYRRKWHLMKRVADTGNADIICAMNCSPQFSRPTSNTTTSWWRAGRPVVVRCRGQCRDRNCAGLADGRRIQRISTRTAI